MFSLIAKVPRANATTKDLSKSLQSQRLQSSYFKKIVITKKIKNADTQADSYYRRNDNNSEIE